METLTTPAWPSDFTKKYWAKNKNSAVKKTGLSERLDKAQSLFAKIKWPLFDASKAKLRAGFKPTIEKLNDTQITPIRVLLREIIVYSNKAANDPKAGAKMAPLCKLMIARATTVDTALEDFVELALSIASVYDTGLQAYHIDLSTYIKGFDEDLDALETEARELTAQTKIALKHLQTTIDRQNGPEAIQSATLAQETATAIIQAADKLEARRSGYQAKMDTGRNISAATYKLTIQDIQVYENLILATRRQFERFDQIYDEITEAAEQAAKCKADAQTFSTQSTSAATKWHAKADSDIHNLEGALNKINAMITSGWGSQISKKGATFVKTAQMVVKAAPDKKQDMLAAAIKTVQDASTLMPKALKSIGVLLQNLEKNCAEYQKAIPGGLQAAFIPELQHMDKIKKEARRVFTEFTQNYATSMQMLKVLKDTIEKHSK